MQAAIDRVMRSFALKPAAFRARETERRTGHDEAESLATQLLDNLKTELARAGGRPH